MVKLILYWHHLVSSSTRQSCYIKKVFLDLCTFYFYEQPLNAAKSGLSKVARQNMLSEWKSLENMLKITSSFRIHGKVKSDYEKNWLIKEKLWNNVRWKSCYKDQRTWKSIWSNKMSVLNGRIWLKGKHKFFKTIICKACVCCLPKRLKYK